MPVKPRINMHLPGPTNKFTKRQARFVEEYLIDFNATQAAIRAGYSKKSAYSTGVENLSKPVIKEALDKAIKKINEKSQDKVAYVINSLVEVTKITNQDRLQHKVKSLELLGKYLALWNDRLDITTEGKAIQPNTVKIIFEEMADNDDGK